MRRNFPINHTECPLCHSQDIVGISYLSVEQLNQEYYKNYRIANACELQEEFLTYCECSSCTLRFFYPASVGSPDFYKELSKYDFYYMDNKYELEIGASAVAQSQKILEVGCGKAQFTKYLDASVDYTGLEINSGLGDLFDNPKIRVLDSSIEDHVNSGELYDAIVTFQVLEHIEKPHEFIKNCLECLPVGGKLVIGVPNGNGFASRVRNDILNMPPHHITHWRDETLIALTRLFSLNCIEIVHEPIASYHTSWAKSAILTDMICKTLGIEFMLLDNRFIFRLVNKLSKILSRYFPPDLNKHQGHTTIAIYEKI